MSRVLDKAFDAGKKIIRSVFKGSPNLITSADLNRQMEAFKCQLDNLEEHTGVTSDILITSSLSASTLTVGYKYSYIRFKGCEFRPESTILSTNFTKMVNTAYLCLVADTEEVTYEDDPTHEIAGAKFEDGTSMPAANQIRYKNEALVLTHATTMDNLVGVLAVFTMSDTGKVITKQNTILANDSFAMGSRDTIRYMDPSSVGRITEGDTYDEAFSILENRFANIAPEWDYLVMSDSGIVNPTDIAFRVQNGLLYLNIPSRVINKTIGNLIYRLGDFPANKKTALLTLLKSMGLESYGKFVSPALTNGTLCVPYGDFGCFPVYGAYEEATGSLPENYPRFGTAKVSLFLEYEQVDAMYSLKDAYIAVYVTGLVGLKEDPKDTTFEGITVATMSSNRNEQIHIHRLISAIPLFR